MDIEKIKAAMQACMTAMDEFLKTLTDDKADEAAKTAAKSAYQAEEKKFAALEGQLELAEVRAKRMATVGRVTQLATVVVPGVIPSAGPAVAKDHNAEQAELEVEFCKFMSGVPISDKARDAMQPKAKNWGEQASVGIAAPTRFAKAILHPVQQAKALPLTSNQASPANLFQADFRNDLLMYEGEEPGVFSRALKIPTKSGQVKWPQLDQGAPGAEGSADEFAEYGGVAVYAAAEGAGAEGTEAKFKQVVLDTFEVTAKTELTRTLISRSPTDLEALLGKLFPKAINHKLDLWCINGNGNGKPKGILQTTGVAGVARKTALQVDHEDLVKLEHAIAPSLRKGAMYIVQDKAVEYLKLKKDSTGRPLYIGVNDTLNNGFKFDRLNGYPAIPLQRMPALGTAGDVIFGNMEHYCCPVEQEVVIAKSEHQKIDQGVIVYVVFIQVGGKVLELRAFSKLIDAA